MMNTLVLITFLVAMRCDLFGDAGDTDGDHEQQFSVDTVGADIDLAQCQLRCLLSARSSPVSLTNILINSFGGYLHGP